MLCLVIMGAVINGAFDTAVYIGIVHHFYSPHTLLTNSAPLQFCPPSYCLQIVSKYTSQITSLLIKYTEVIFVTAISTAILIIFAVMGIIYCVREITYFLYKNKNNCSIIIVTPLENETHNAEFILRGAASRLKWFCRGGEDCILCLDCDMDEETESVCKALCKEYGFIKLIKKQELIELLNK